MQLLKEVKLPTITEANLDFQMVTLAFLPTEADRLREALENARALSSSDEFWVARFADYDRVMDSCETVAGAHNVSNMATGILLMAALAGRHFDELQQVWADEELNPRQKGAKVPYAAVLGSVSLSGALASRLVKALNHWRAHEKNASRPAAEALVEWAEKSEGAKTD